jgi:hypothetical protein
MCSTRRYCLRSAARMLTRQEERRKQANRRHPAAKPRHAHACLCMPTKHTRQSRSWRPHEKQIPTAVTPKPEPTSNHSASSPARVCFERHSKIRLSIQSITCMVKKNGLWGRYTQQPRFLREDRSGIRCARRISPRNPSKPVQLSETAAAPTSAGNAAARPRTCAKRVLIEMPVQTRECSASYKPASVANSGNVQAAGTKEQVCDKRKAI